MDIHLSFSNRLEVLYQNLKINLFQHEQSPFIRRLVVVYGPVMKNWLMLKIAQDPDLKVAMGIEFIYLNQAFEYLIKLFSRNPVGHFPSALEIALAIEKELIEVLQNIHDMTIEEQKDWNPIIQYLKLEPYHLKETLVLSRKMEKRLIGLSQKLARLFIDYGRYAHKMVKQWNCTNPQDWQARLWKRLFEGKWNWTYLTESMQIELEPKTPFQNGIHPDSKTGPCSTISIHLFSINFITSSEFQFLQKIGNFAPISLYCLSPCAVFWSDTRTDRESAYLQRFWQKKFGRHAQKILHLEELLQDRNPILANFGRLGREMAQLIEESSVTTNACYILPETLSENYQELAFQNDLYLEKNSSFTLLQALQADLILMRNPEEQPSFDFEADCRSIQVHVAPGSRREVEILYQNLLNIIKNDPTIQPQDIIVMAPDIQNYTSYIHTIFGENESCLDYQILDLGMQIHNQLAQGFLQLLELCEGRWDSVELLQLFEHPYFCRRHQFSSNDFILIKKWVEEAGMLWGENRFHRNEILIRRYCEKEMVDESNIGTWEYGLTRLLKGLISAKQQSLQNSSDSVPYLGIEFSQGELLGKWIHLLHSLKDDLTPLQDRSKLTIDDWVNYLNCLIDNYFYIDKTHSTSFEESLKIKNQLEILRSSTKYFKDAIFPFSTVKAHLLSLLKYQEGSFREDQIQAVHFCSLMPMRSIPAKVIVLLGMQEGAFPRLSDFTSLNRMLGHQEVDYCPLNNDYDRYLFLEAIHSAQQHLLISYQGYHQKENKELQASLVVEELLSYLEKYYTIQGEKISKKCIFRHPLNSFHYLYFSKENGLVNYSKSDFQAAKAFYLKEKKVPHQFVSSFPFFQENQQLLFPTGTQIELKHLSSLARNPIKFYLQKVLEIYLQNDESRRVKTEEQLEFSGLDRYLFKEKILSHSFDTVLNNVEKEGKLPLGLFKSVAIKRLKDDMLRLNKHLRKHDLDVESLFQIEFKESCSTPYQENTQRWIFPACQLIYEDGYQLSIVGKVSNLSPQGLLSISKGTFIEAWKNWPHFLLFCYAAKQKPDLFKNQLIMIESSKPFQAFFEDPDKYLKQFIHYYSYSIQNISPLVPEWIPLIINEDHVTLKENMRLLFKSSFGTYQKEELKWVFNKKTLPCAKQIINEWRDPAHHLAGELMQHWFPSKASKIIGDENETL
ncbi:MAG: exodeoxyribonuclease V subunit gamma [Parachlamydiaceae bacterium]|nr:exodeoxyribonuclease V subunit gamma [Parachlamydiaceae bacterium]